MTDGVLLRILTSDGHETTVPAAALALSATIKGLLDDGVRVMGSTTTTTTTTIPLPNVTRPQLDLIVSYCLAHGGGTGDSGSPGRNPPFPVGGAARRRGTAAVTDDNDSAFLASIPDTATLVDLMSAVSYLDVTPLSQLLCRHLATLVRDKSTEEIREMLGIENDLSPEEEADIQRDIRWLLNH